MKESSLVTLIRSKKTVFDMNDLVLLWGITDRDYLKTKVYRLAKAGQLIRLRGGIYALDWNYDRLELANKLVVPSYVSFETVLAREGVVFQYDPKIYSAARVNRTIKIGKEEFVYRKIKDPTLLDPLGLIQDGEKSVASKERAICDTLYLMGDFYFDNLSDIDWIKCLKIGLIYDNKNLIKRIKKLKEEYAS